MIVRARSVLGSIGGKSLAVGYYPQRMSYRVELPVFSGPMDLLLHLVRQEEVDIHEVSLSRILANYLAHLQVLQVLDLADIGEFVVMASTLMEIKSRELLPKEAVSLEQELDPRDDLIRKLLEYKRYRDLARKLDRYAQRRAKMLEASLPLPKELHDAEDEQDTLDLADVSLWTLTQAFAKLLEETGQSKTLTFGVEKRTVRYYTEQILAKVRGRSDVRFEELFDTSEGRYGLIGIFCAMLELMKQGFLRAFQEECFAPIVVAFTGPEDLTADQVLAQSEREAPETLDTEPSPAG